MLNLLKKKSLLLLALGLLTGLSSCLLLNEAGFFGDSDEEDSGFLLGLLGSGGDADIDTGDGSIPVESADQEIAITIDGTEYTHNSTYDFGSTTENVAKDAVTFRIENRGAKQLSLTGSPLVNKSGAASSEYAIIQPSADSIDGGSSLTFTVQFSPTSTGTKTAQVVIANNDSDEGSYTINLTGVATAAPGTELVANWNKSFLSGSSEGNDFAIDSNGNLYVADSPSNRWRIKKFESTGSEDLVNWNFSAAPNGSVSHAIAIDSNDNVYVVGYGNNSAGGGPDWLIKKYNSAGVEDTTSWNKSFTGPNSNNDIAYDVAIDSKDNVYVVGYGTNLANSSSADDWWIKKFNSNGVEDTTNWNKVINCSNWCQAYTVAIDSNDNVYVAGIDNLNVKVRKFDSAGHEDTVNWNKYLGAVNSSDPPSIAFNSANDVFITRSNNGCNLRKFSNAGIEDTSWRMNIGSICENHHGLVVDDSGNLYITYKDSTNVKIKKFNSSAIEDAAYWNKTINSVSGNAEALVFDPNTQRIYSLHMEFPSFSTWYLWIKAFSR